MVETTISMIDVLTCPLCGSSFNVLFDQRAFHGKVILNRKCNSCGFVFQSPRMTQDQLDKFYLSEYRQLYQGKVGPIKKDLAIQSARADNLMKFAQEHGIQHLERHLDIGSSAGLLLSQFKLTYQCIPVGIEPGEAYREAAQKNGLKVYAQLEQMTHGLEDRFNLISLIHVLEHFPDPVRVLSNLREEWLAPDGWLLLEVPNLYCHDCFEIAHLASYSSHTIEEVLKRAGYQIIAIREYGEPRSAILPLYITVLAKRASNPAKMAFQQVEPESFVRLKRQFGLLRRKILERLRPDLAWLPVCEE